ncbi:MAG: ABC transporter permease subunit [Bosea sp.]|uniref:ABC transporter permease n=1 Tax=Bosea sp. (in: a-proteobacteria) TaxID=1871050 RepID=UPI00238B5C8F|nr:ABC transporter permease subunit [Bosea sp. (in: a-proteobacteria)]MCP4739615.1 ABC transporter permease subunit [Bosea sp. (in: a-proteobacteria)]
MTTLADTSLHLLRERQQPRPLAWSGLSAGLAWAAVAISAVAWPDVSDWLETRRFALGAAIFAAGFISLTLAGRWLPRAGDWIREAGPWATASGIALTLWQLASAKFGWLPLPFFPPPQALLEVYTEDYATLGASVFASMKLLVTGFVVGAVLGFLTGVAIGWSRQAGYWVHPVLRFIGPLPATAWLPIAFFAFPSSWSASIFLIALATGFPVTVLTWSGIASVNSRYYDVARTLGAKPGFLILRVAIPAALPHVFVGLFMALGSAFSVLMVAELVGVKAGIGFYMQWAQGWASYANVYAALVVLALLCSGSITLLFRLRDRVLSWQKGLVQW